MFTTGWAAPRRRSASRTADVLALKAHNLDATIFGPRPKFRRPYPSGIANLRVIVAHRRDARAGRCGCWSTRSWSITYFILCRSSRDCLKTLRSSFNSARASRVYWPCYCQEERLNRGHRHASGRLFPHTAGDCRVCPSAFWRRSAAGQHRAGVTTMGFSAPHIRAKLVSRAALIESQRVPPPAPEPKGAPRSLRSASVGRERCCNCRKCPRSRYREKPKRH